MAAGFQGGLVQAAKRTATTTTGRVFGLICLMYFITYVDRVNVSTLAPLMSKELGLSNIQLGLVLSAFGYPYALLQILGGTAADKFGARKTLTICGGIWALSTIATGFVGGLFSLLLVRIFVGIGEGATFPAATRAMASWVPESRRGYAQGMVHSASRLANAITPPLVILIAAYLGWRGAFLALGCVSMVWVLAWLFYFRDNPRDHTGVSLQEIALLPEPRQKTQAGAVKVPWGPLTRAMMPTTLVYFCYNWTFWLYITWLPSYFVQAYGLELKHMAAFTFAIFAAGVVGDTLGGVLTDFVYHRTGDLPASRRLVVVFSLIASMICLIPALFVHDLVTIGFSLASAFFFLELTVGPIWAVPMDIAPHFSGTASGIMNTGSAIAGIVSPIAFGLVIDLTHSYTLPFYGSVLLLMIGACIAFFFMPSRGLVASSATENATTGQANSPRISTMRDVAGQ
ncbi:MFS transporter [Beijerinckia indica]|uniref:Major facilitator superfamily MFS_1 n=1 Tax=Beijerinckia indica subsp. indica (strain ATCC 9039 / DSM 1715 / NCIMB 8712) TaxID=395963 RepID=B2IGR8_BEII9|nr:MFS transporter [Beijerinckia indica]ACB95829.1 major facilitator superfamily MFS_1 [Beijerinckia indica subsp. indica ATCC 9039]